MIGLDTNILARFLLKDDLAHYVAATEYLNRLQEREQPVMIHLPTLCELLWVLTQAYRVKREALIDMMQTILNTEAWHIEHRELVNSALEEYRMRSIDLADIIMGKYYRKLGCETTITFDRKAAKLKEFTHIDDA
jgi:predicted nucleic-acid-binding protein